MTHKIKHRKAGSGGAVARDVFAQGHADGLCCSRERGDTPPTAREVHDARPELSGAEVSLYLNGFEDGLNRDTFRLAILPHPLAP